MKKIAIALLVLSAVVTEAQMSIRNPFYSAALQPVSAETPPASCTTEQNWSTNTPTGIFTLATGAFYGFGQRFIASNSFNCCKIQAFLGVVGTPPQTFYGSIWTSTNADGVGGPIASLGFSPGVSGGGLSDTNWVEFTFDPVIPLTNDATYYLVIHSPTLDADNYLNWYRTSPSYSNSVWQAGSATNWSRTAENRMLQYKVVGP